jgi:hypothetical protein
MDNAPFYVALAIDLMFMLIIGLIVGVPALLQWRERRELDRRMRARKRRSRASVSLETTQGVTPTGAVFKDNYSEGSEGPYIISE